MIRPFALPPVVLSAALLAFAQASAQAQTSTKPPLRLPPNASETSRIPAGVDTGSPGSSDTLPLGTPVPPTIGADRGELSNRSAAARAAARPKLSASAVPDCVRPQAGKAEPAPLPKNTLTGRKPPPAPTPPAPGATRVDC